MNEATSTGRLLGGVLVCDVTQDLAGPICGRLLAELGATVVHVERLTGGNERNITTPHLGREGIFHTVGNRSKQGIAVDMKQESGVEVVRRLATRSDVLLQNLGPGAMDRLGLGYDALSAINPGLVYGSVTAYGVRGREAGLKGFDFLMQAMLGLTTVDPDQQERSFVFGGPLSDTATPLLLALAVVAALFRRATTGHGEHVESSLLQGSLHMLSPNLLQVDDDPALATEARVPLGGGDPTTGVFKTGDEQWITIVAFNDGQFHRLCTALELHDLVADTALARQQARQEAAPRIRGAVREAVGARTAAELDALLDAADVPHGPAYDTPKSTMTRPSIWREEVFGEVVHPTKGRMVQPMSGMTVAGQGLGPTGPAPLLGQHTREVLHSLSYTDEEIEHLHSSGVVHCGDPVSEPATEGH